MAERRYECDWRGMLRKRWRWLRWRFEWGRYCTRSNAFGTGPVWWEWEGETGWHGEISERQK
jgi:hypothetical protein